MSRSENLLRKFQGNPPLPTNPEPDDNGYEELQSPLVSEYNVTQNIAQQELEKEQKAIEKTNPHSLYTDIVTKPSPKNAYPMRIMGRPLNLQALEDYVIFKVSPRTIVTSMRYNDVRTTEDTLNYSKRPLGRHGRKKGFPWFLIIMIIIMVGVGAFLLFGGGDISGMMQGFMP